MDKGEKTKNMLKSICESLMHSNNDLNEKHEKMLDYEKEQRTILTQGFQHKMNKVQEDLQKTKEQRTQAMNKNDELREKINKAIEEYKVKENAFKTKIGEHNKNVEKIQENIQKELKEGSVGKTAKEYEKYQTEFKKTTTNIEKITGEI